MTVEDLIEDSIKIGSKLHSKGAIVLSTRTRIARNVKGKKFVTYLKDEEKKELGRELVEILMSSEYFSDGVIFYMPDLDRIERQVLYESRFISRNFLKGEPGSYLVISPSHRLAAMINEEDHLRLYCINPGDNIEETYRIVQQAESDIERRVEFAFDREFGYLTSCPTNVGTGLRVSAMFHLGGLSMCDEITQVINGLRSITMEVRGIFGEGSDAAGNLFQISNCYTLGIREDEIINRIKFVVKELIKHEENARQRLMEDKKEKMIDLMSRCMAIVKYAYSISSEEAINLLYALRLGVDLGIISIEDKDVFNKLIILVQPGYLQKVAGEKLNSSERDRIRAILLKKELTKISIKIGRQDRKLLAIVDNLASKIRG